MAGRTGWISAALAAALVAQAGPALAQAGGSGQGGTPSPASACRKPELSDRPRVDKSEIERVTAATQDYVDCMRPVLEDTRKRAEALIAEGRKAAEASNTMANEVNAFVEAYRRWAQEKASEAN
ncbi:hypothetical protein [Sphingomonas colocasiae]|uniref:Uncharacterized protein n=1 Tax=Sphingomonas colocasiae TaxID=1848973 RepID=A0ABS7PQ40_9SPHN|nr:hypothetical protein [Sphingomonas colocasiae]MBY8823433.1 hypothetical protein [Sphingomonas colocasiae]